MIGRRSTGHSMEACESGSEGQASRKSVNKVGMRRKARGGRTRARDRWREEKESASSLLRVGADDGTRLHMRARIRGVSV